jgi:Domain of unknown function (DUF4307)
VTQTSPTNDSTASGDPVFPPGRYGHRRERARRRWIAPSIAVGVLLITALISVKLFNQYGQAQFTPTVTNLSNLTDNSITVTFIVDKPGGGPAVCTVDALAYSHAQVGTAEVNVPSGTHVQVKYTLSTTERAYVADVPSCRASSR